MLLKNLFRTLAEYKLNLITIVFFELLYLIKGYKGNKFNFNKNDLMADDIPCPYHFLIKIKKTLKKNNFNKLLDLGCGSGRIIDFFDKNFPNKDYIGIEYFPSQYNYSKKIFQNRENIKIVQADFTKTDFFKYDPDCYFFNNPFKKDLECIEFIEKTINFSLNKKKILFIFINVNKKVIENLRNIQCIESYYIKETKGFSICCLNT
jgi:SAM-dependent methyltransferase|tara:strand:- start:257 stop:874 length:618 start_codon:yes stop_codon:yes gene_type:complete